MNNIATLPFPATAAARLARLAILGAVAGLTLAAAPQQAEARSFLEGQSNGMRKCVRAILGGYEVKRVNVHGHHFNCKPMARGSARWPNRRQIWLSHSQRGPDDQVLFNFEVNSLNEIDGGRPYYRIIRGISVKSFGSIIKPEFHGPPGLPADYDYYAEQARRVSPVEVKRWQVAAIQILTVALAEFGNPDSRGTAPRQVDCELPTFWEHDNFRGRSYKLGGSQPNFHKVIVGGKPFGDVISSMCVPRGWTVTAYTDTGYRGISRTFGGPRELEDLKRQPAGNGGRLNWGDVISSVRVSRR